ncbi:MAG: hypothetical protein ACKOET_12885 [Verrucomicrobiota bacterium]
MIAEAEAFQQAVRPVMDQVLLGHDQLVLGYQPAASLRERIDQLASRHTEGDLTEEERAEYAGYVRANKFLAQLRRLALMSAASPH